MELLKLFQLQETLDARILQQHNLERDSLLKHKILALLVELGELANETRCFKYWSKKPCSPKDIILEEYVDGLHFILSLGIDSGFHDKEEIKAVAFSKEMSLTDQFLAIYSLVHAFSANLNEQSYENLLGSYISLGQNLGFSWSEINEAYFSKNETNHTRQNQGY